uniref:Uncharacterized protein n=1 Tax=Opuntia streptacantha TaxID=393608 RepID=A0A7C8YFH6_OPUST
MHTRHSSYFPNCLSRYLFRHKGLWDHPQDVATSIIDCSRNQTHQPDAPSSIYQVNFPFNQLVSKLKGSKLEAGVLARATTTEDTNPLEPRRLHGLHLKLTIAKLVLSVHIYKQICR